MDADMKLNLRMIMDSLELPYEHVSGNPDGAMRLADAYPYIPGRRADNPDILYLALWEQLRGSEAYPKNVICIGARFRRFSHNTTISSAPFWTRSLQKRRSMTC
jgi:hypothetical protein